MAENKPSESTSIPSRSVLLLYDEYREFFTHFLRHRGYLAHWASSGKVAVAMLRQRRYDLLVVDDFLLAIGGFELRDILRTGQIDKVTKAPPSLFIVFAGYQQAVRQYGAEHVLEKPIVPSVLVDRMNLLSTRNDLDTPSNKQ